MLRDLGLEDAKPAPTPGAKPAKGEAIDEAPLDPVRHRTYRSVVARGNFLAQDRPDIRFAVKELCRRMSNPRECDWASLKRLARYLKGKPRLVQRMTIAADASPDVE
eukprot:976199-Lingulodinium_polyedra.AAC.1